MKKLLIFILMLASVRLVQGQAFRWSSTAQTVNISAPQPGILVPALNIPNATVALCTYPANATPCTNYATTYTDPSGTTTCPSTAQLTANNSAICISKSDAQGNVGAWIKTGNYQYTVTTAYGSYGPYDLSVGNTSTGGGGTVAGLTPSYLPVATSPTGITTSSLLYQDSPTAPTQTATNAPFFVTPTLTGTYPTNNTASSRQKAFWPTLISQTPGYSWSFPTLGPHGWQSTNAVNITNWVYGKAIAEVVASSLYHGGTNDTANHYLYTFSQGGRTTANDEGVKGLGNNVYEWPAVYTGTVSSGTVGGQQIVTSCVTGCANAGNSPGNQGVGHYVIIPSRAASNNIVSIGNGLNSKMSAVTLANAVTQSVAWGTTNADINTPQNMACNYGVSSLTSVAAGTGVYTGTIFGGTPSLGTTTASAASSSTTLTVANVAPISPGMGISGTGIPANTTVSSVNYNNNTLVISQATTGTLTNTTVTFTNNGLAGCVVTIAGFSGANNGTFTIASSTATTITTNNSSSTSASASGSATIVPFATLETVNITITSGTYNTTDPICFISYFRDCTVPVAVGTVTGGIQSVTVPLRSAHPSGTEVFQGIMSGQGVEFVGWTQVSNGVTFRYLADIDGCTSTTVCQTSVWYIGDAAALSTALSSNYQPSQLYGCFNASTLSNSGTTTVTGTFSSFCAGGGYGSVQSLPAVTLSISGASDSAFNTLCTGVSWASYPTFTCTISGLTGTHTATSAVAALGQAITNGPMSAVRIYPAVQVLDVQNYTTNPPSVDGTLTVEANPDFNYSPGDTLEQPHYIAAEFQAATMGTNTFNPVATSSSAIVVGWNGAQGGGPSTTSAIISASNSGPLTPYAGFGGWWTAADMLNFDGAYRTGINFHKLPQPGQSFIWLRSLGAPAGTMDQDPNYSYNFRRIDNLGGGSLIENEVPYTGAVSLTNSVGSLFFDAPNWGIGSPGHTGAIINTTLTTPSGFIASSGYNFAPYSNTINGPTWNSLGGATPTINCTGVQDDNGDPACTFSATGSSNWKDNNTGAYTNLSATTAYTIQARIQGAAGGEQVTLGGGDVAASPVFWTVTTSFANYCSTFTTTSSSLNVLANLNLNNAGGGTFTISNLVVRPGTTCGPPLITQANQYTSLTPVNHFPKVDASQITLAGAATNTANGLAKLNSSAALPTANICTGTPSSGQYCDGGSGAWTNIPGGSSTAAPPWLMWFGDGSEGVVNCSTSIVDGEHWYSSFTVSNGNTCTITAGGTPGQSPLIIRSTGTCTIAGTLSADGRNGTSSNWGGGGGGGGGGTGAGGAGQAGFGGQGGGTAGAASGGNAGNGSLFPAQNTRNLLVSGAVPFMTGNYSSAIFNYMGGAAGGAGGSSGGAAGAGGGMIVLDCATISFTGTISSQGTAGGASTGNNIGPGGGGGGGVVILRSPNLTNSGTISVGGGAAGSCGAFTGCGAGGTGAAGWSKVISQ